MASKAPGSKSSGQPFGSALGVGACASTASSASRRDGNCGPPVALSPTPPLPFFLLLLLLLLLLFLLLLFCFFFFCPSAQAFFAFLFSPRKETHHFDGLPPGHSKRGDRDDVAAVHGGPGHGHPGHGDLPAAQAALVLHPAPRIGGSRRCRRCRPTRATGSLGTARGRVFFAWVGREEYLSLGLEKAHWSFEGQVFGGWKAQAHVWSGFETYVSLWRGSNHVCISVLDWL